MSVLSILLGLVKGLIFCQLVGSSADTTSLIVSPLQVKPDVAIVASIDGTLHLVNTKTKDVKWSLFTGQRVYSSYQADAADNASEPGSGDFYYLDCGDDWELYLHSKNSGKLQKLGLSAEEYVRRLPHVWNDGQITLGEKKTTAFVVDAHIGTIINSFGSETNISSTELDKPNNPFLLVNESATASPEVWKDTQNVIFFTRTDYVFRHYSPYSSDALWSVSFAEIEAEFRCPAIGASLTLEGRTNLNFPCHLRTTVPRVRDREPLELDKVLPSQFRYSTKNLPGFDSVSFLPTLPYTRGPIFAENQETSFLLPVTEANSFLALPPSSLQNIPMLEGSKERASSNYSFSSFASFKSIMLYIMIALITVVGSFWSVIAVKRRTPQVKSHAKKKKARKGGNNMMESTKGQSNGFANNQMEDDYERISLDEKGLKISFDKLGEEMANGRRIGKLLVSPKEIAKGSNGTVVLEGVYGGREVAVKRLVQTHHEVAVKEIQNLIASDQHPNIVRWYGVENDTDFIYIALERCSSNLNDFIHAQSQFYQHPTVEGNSSHLHSLWDPNGYPSPLLLKVMRDVVQGLAHLHELGMIHRDIKPQNVLILNEKSVSAKLSDMGISKRLMGDVSALTLNGTGCGSSGWQAPEQLLQQRQTRAVDLFSLGCVLFFCITGGKHPFGDPLERDMNVVNDKKDLFLVEHIPEVFDLLSRLLEHNPKTRPKASEVLNHPLFWSPDKKLSFLEEASDRVELEDRAEASELLDAVEGAGTASLRGRWDEKMEPLFLSNIGRYRRYRFDSVRDLLRVIRNKSHHYRELPHDLKCLLGPHPDGFVAYFSKRFPNLLIEVYKVFLSHCHNEEFLLKYKDIPPF